MEKSEVAKKSVSARPGSIPEGTLGIRMEPGQAGMGPTSGPGWVRNAVKQSTWRIWTGPLRTRDGTWTGPGSVPGEDLDGTRGDSNRRLGLSEILFFFFPANRFVRIDSRELPRFVLRIAGPSNPKHQNLLFWDLSLFSKLRLKSPNLVDFWSRKCLFYRVRKKRFRLILKTRDF